MSQAPKQELGLFDSVSIIVGIVVGVGIYRTAPDVAGSVSTTAAVLGLWVLGGAFSLAGALCYAELATAYPQQGGDYVYLSRAFGGGVGYLFGWGQLIIVRPGNIASMGFVFADYAQRLVDMPGDGQGSASYRIVIAAAAALALTFINLLGARQGKWTQNVLTSIKVVGLLAIISIAFMSSQPRDTSAPTGVLHTGGLRLAMIFILFTYGGWNETAYVAAEVKNPRKNLTRALVLGTCGVTLLYLLLNCAFFYALGHGGVAAADAVATDAVATVFPGVASKAVTVLICVSALGAMNGIIFAGARISYAMGQEGGVFRPLGRWSQRFASPVMALLVQGGIAVTTICIAGNFKNTVLYMTTTVWVFFLATGLAVFVLRIKEPQIPRPYRTTGHPWTTLVFCASSAFLIHSALMYDRVGSLVSLGVLLAGLLVYPGLYRAIWSRRDGNSSEPSGE